MRAISSAPRRLTRLPRNWPRFSRNQPDAHRAFPTNDYYTVTPGSLDTDQGDGRVDYHLNDANSIFGSISWTNTNKLSTSRLSPEHWITVVSAETANRIWVATET